MTQLPIEREAILPRLDGIRKNIKKLKSLAQLPFEEFSTGDPYDLAQHHLRLALEGGFHISSHVLSRLPGERAVEYREVALKMGSAGIVPLTFAREKMVAMAGLRNILVHQYSDLDPERLLGILKNHLGDLEKFLSCIKTLVADPGKFGLTIS